MKSRLALFFLVASSILSGCAGKGSSILPQLQTGGRLHVAQAAGSPTLVQVMNDTAWSPSVITVTFSTAPVAGDVLVVFLNNNGNSSGTANSYTPPAGWTAIDVDAAHAYNSFSAFYHIVGTGESGSYNFTPSCACKNHVWAGAEISGVNPSSAIDQHGFTFVQNSTTWTTPNLTPSATGDFALVAMMPTTSSLTWTNAAGWTADEGPFSIWSGEMLSQVLSVATPVSETSTLSASSTGYAAMVLLAPSGGGPPPTQTPPPTPTPLPTPTGTPGAAPALVQRSTSDSWAPSSITVSFSTTPQAGDTLFVFFNNNGNSSGTANTYTAPAGWNRIDLDASHAYITYESFYHVVGTGEANSYTFTPSCACKEHVWIAEEVSGANTSSPIDRHGFTFVANSTSWATPAEVPSGANDFAVVAMLPTTSGRTWSNAAGWTQDVGPITPWSGEALHQTLSGSGSVSEVSALSGSSTGHAAIVLISPSAGVQPTPTPQPNKIDWDTWGMRPSRNSYNPSESTLTTSNVGMLRQLWSTGTGGVITAQPMLAANVTGTSAGTADVLYVGDAHADFYALNAANGQSLWQKTLQTQFIDGNAQATMFCFDQPAGIYGIGGAPVIDRSSSLAYVVDALGSLYGFDIATGSQKAGPTSMWPFQNGVNITNDYGGLTEDKGSGVIYVPSGAHCGLPTYGGMQQYNISNGSVANFFTEGPPPATDGGVWGPGGAVMDPRGGTNIYFGTGDGPTGTGMYPYSIVKMSESLSVLSAHNPIATCTTSCIDYDFGDTPLVFTPSSSGCGRTLVAAENKNAKFFVYDADSIGTGPLQTIQLGTASEDGNNLGSPAYDPTKNLVFVQSGSDSSDTTTGLKHGLIAFTVTSSCTLQYQWQLTVGPNQQPDGPPQPPTIANGVVYYADGPSTGCSPIANSSCSPSGDFYAVNETNGGVLFHSTLSGALFTAPVVVNGHVYLTSWKGGGSGAVYAFGL